MFIPINIERRLYKKDDIVVSIKEIRNGYGFFTVGHEFTVVKKVHDYSYYTLIDNEYNIIVKKVDPDFFTLKTEIDKARQIYIDISEKNKAIYFIKQNCPQKGVDYDDRDEYDSCKLKKGYSNICMCNLSCVNYVSESKIDKNDFMKIYLRKVKIKKLKND